MDEGTIYAILDRAYFSDEPHEAAAIKHLPRLLKNARLVVDVGASLGQYTRAAAASLANATIHAVEADPARYRRLTKNCAEWADASTSKLVAHHAAVTDRAGEATFFTTNSDISGGLEIRETRRPVDWTPVTVPAVTLDGMFRTETPDFVKIDVEGAELHVLQGAQRLLANGSPVVLVEIHDWPATELVAMMRQLGYLRVGFHGQTVFTKRRLLYVRLIVHRILSDPRTVIRRVFR